MRDRRARQNRFAARQHGSYLLEGAIALLIFSFGVLGCIGSVAASIRASADARYRFEATNLANAMVGDMWTTRSDALDSEFGAGGAKLAAWQAEAARLLPSAVAANVPQVDLTQAGLSTRSRSVVVTLFWQLPGDPQRHQIVMTAEIGKNS